MKNFFSKINIFLLVESTLSYKVFTLWKFYAITKYFNFVAVAVLTVSEFNNFFIKWDMFANERRICVWLQWWGTDAILRMDFIVDDFWVGISAHRDDLWAIADSSPCDRWCSSVRTDQMKRRGGGWKGLSHELLWTIPFGPKIYKEIRRRWKFTVVIWYWWW